MELIKIGVIVNTHGIKGELRIISRFEYKDRVFKIGNKLYFKNNSFLIINSYRKHKNYDMVVFEGIDDISVAAQYKQKEVYFNKEELYLKASEYLEKDLIGLDVFYNNTNIGKIEDIEINSGNKLFVINKKLIPYNNNFIKEIIVKENKIVLKNIEGLI